MVTRTEASWVPELLTTRHTYSPESAGVTWGSRSLEPCTWEGRQVHSQAPTPFPGTHPSQTWPDGALGKLFQGEPPFMTLQFPCPRVGTGSSGKKWGTGTCHLWGR